MNIKMFQKKTLNILNRISKSHCLTYLLPVAVQLPVKQKIFYYFISSSLQFAKLLNADENANFMAVVFNAKLLQEKNSHEQLRALNKLS